MAWCSNATSRSGVKSAGYLVGLRLQKCFCLDQRVKHMDIQRKGANRYKLRRTVYAGVGAIALVLLLLVGKGLASRPPALDTDVIWTGTVTRGEVVREVTAAGALVSRELRTVTNTNDGVVERILALAGQTVQPESVLIEMSSPTLEDELASAR